MRVLQISTCWAQTPPRGNGGIEWVVSYLTEELVKMGHDVTLFATGDSITGARLLPASDKPKAFGGWADEVVHVGKACEYIADNQFDIVHNHHFLLGLVPLYLTRTPCVTSIHLPRYPTYSMLQQALAERHNYVALSHSQRKLDPTLPWVATVHNGIDIATFPYEATKEDYLLSLGRVSGLKGMHHAIAVAKRCRRRLVIAGPVEERDAQFYREEIEPHVNGEDIVYAGEVNFDQKVQLYRHATALLFTSEPEYQEPCPLVPIEALACGTPVIGFANGALPELVAHNRVGFVVNDIDEMAAAVNKITQIDPQACREFAEQNFSSRSMAERYVKVYEEILSRSAS